MCRIAAYLGPPIRLSALLSEPPHGLEHQSRYAREMSDSSMAGDGWGAGWFVPGKDRTPGMIKSIQPLWSDENAKTASHAISSGSFVGHIRYASPGIEVCFTNTPLYVLDDRLWTINGQLQPWPGPLSKAIRDRLDPDHEAEVRGSTDGEMLGALWRTEFRRAGGRDAAGALRAALRIALDETLERDGEVHANLILADASGFLATRFAHPGEPGSLYLLEDDPRWPGGRLVASEPLDDAPGWREVPPSSLVRADAEGVRVEPLAVEPGESRTRRGSA